jgi:hypothetical protein
MNPKPADVLEQIGNSIAISMTFDPVRRASPTDLVDQIVAADEHNQQKKQQQSALFEDNTPVRADFVHIHLLIP